MFTEINDKFEDNIGNYKKSGIVDLKKIQLKIKNIVTELKF